MGVVDAPPFTIPLVAGAGGFFAPYIRAYIKRAERRRTSARTVVNDGEKATATRTPIFSRPIQLEEVMDSPMLWDPLRYDETCPSSDGACAVIIGTRPPRWRARPGGLDPGYSMRSEPTMFAGKDQVNPAAGRVCAAAFWAAGRHHRSAEQIDAAEIYVPFSWYEPMWLEKLGFTWWGRMEADRGGETEFGGRLPSTRRVAS